MISKKPITMPIAGDDSDEDQLPEHGRGGAQQLTGAVVAPSVLQVGHELDDHAREQRRGDEAEQQRQQRERGSGRDEQRR